MYISNTMRNINIILTTIKRNLINIILLQQFTFLMQNTHIVFYYYFNVLVKTHSNCQFKKICNESVVVVRSQQVG